MRVTSFGVTTLGARMRPIKSASAARPKAIKDVAIVAIAAFVILLVFDRRHASEWAFELTLLACFGVVVGLMQSAFDFGERTIIVRRASIACFGLWGAWLVASASAPSIINDRYVVSTTLAVVSIGTYGLAHSEFIVESRKSKVIIAIVCLCALIPVETTRDMDIGSSFAHTIAFGYCFYAILFLHLNNGKIISVPFILVCSVWMLVTPLKPFGAVYVGMLARITVIGYGSMERAMDEQPIIAPAPAVVPADEPSAARRSKRADRAVKVPSSRLAMYASVIDDPTSYSAPQFAQSSTMVQSIQPVLPPPPPLEDEDPIPSFESVATIDMSALDE
jgi:hypothetical protein